MLTTDRPDPNLPPQSALSVILLPGEEHRVDAVGEIYGPDVEVLASADAASATGRFVQFLGAGDTPLPRGVAALVAALETSTADAAVGRTLRRSAHDIALASHRDAEIGAPHTAADLASAPEIAAARELGAWVFRTRFLQSPGPTSDLVAVLFGEQGRAAAPELALLAHVAAHARIDVVPSPTLRHRLPRRAEGQDIGADLADLVTYLRSELAAHAVLAAPADSPAHRAWSRSVVTQWLPGRLRLLIADGRPLPERLGREAAGLAQDLGAALSPAVLAPQSPEQALVALLASGHLASAVQWTEPVLTSREPLRRDDPAVGSLVAAAGALAERLGRSHPLVRRLVALTAEDLCAEVRHHGEEALSEQRLTEFMKVDLLVPPDAAGVRGLGAMEGFARAALRGDRTGAVLRSLSPRDLRLTRVSRRGTAWLLTGTAPRHLSELELWLSLGVREDPSTGTAFLRIGGRADRAAAADDSVRWSAVLPTALPVSGTLLLCAASTSETVVVRADADVAVGHRGNCATVEPDGGVRVRVGNGPVLRGVRRALRVRG